MADEVRTVLVADADEGTRSLVGLTLGTESYTIVEADDTESTLKAIAAHKPDLLLIDAGLPGAGGVRICKSVKSQPETDHAKVILLFAKSEPVDEDEGDDAGVDEYVAKPFTSFGLLKKVNEVMGTGE